MDTEYKSYNIPKSQYYLLYELGAIVPVIQDIQRLTVTIVLFLLPLPFSGFYGCH